MLLSSGSNLFPRVPYCCCPALAQQTYTLKADGPKKYNLRGQNFAPVNFYGSARGSGGCGRSATAPTETANSTSDRRISFVCANQDLLHRRPPNRHEMQKTTKMTTTTTTTAAAAAEATGLNRCKRNAGAILILNGERDWHKPHN